MPNGLLARIRPHRNSIWLPMARDHLGRPYAEWARLAQFALRVGPRWRAVSADRAAAHRQTNCAVMIHSGQARLLCSRTEYGPPSAHTSQPRRRDCRSGELQAAPRRSRRSTREDRQHAQCARRLHRSAAPSLGRRHENAIDVEAEHRGEQAGADERCGFLHIGELMAGAAQGPLGLPAPNGPGACDSRPTVVRDWRRRPSATTAIAGIRSARSATAAATHNLSCPRKGAECPMRVALSVTPPPWPWPPTLMRSPSRTADARACRIDAASERPRSWYRCHRAQREREAGRPAKPRLP